MGDAIGITELAVILAAFLLGGFVKGVTGSGLPVIAIPVMASFTGVETAVVISVLPAMTSNVQLIAANRGALGQTRNLGVLVTVGVVGVAAGTVLLTTVDERLMGLVLAATIVAYIVLNTARPSFALSERAARRSAAPVGLISGIIQGGTGVSSPILVPYIHAYRLGRPAYVISITILFFVYACIQLPSMWVAGLLTPERLAAGLLSVIPLFVAVRAGIRYGSRLQARTFDYWVFGVLGLTAVKLIVDAFS